MSESDTPFDGGPMGGPASRPQGDGVPPIGGGLTPPGRGDSVDPLPSDGDIGEDTGGMDGER
jgi:hypothetical protein